jgi:TfoX/Sxy family transcriptional regulator of competence genes
MLKRTHPPAVHFTPTPPALLARFERTAAALPGVERRKMFGRPAIFVNGHMCAGLVASAMILRLNATDTPRFLALPGAAPFMARKRQPTRQWAIVPPAMSDAELRRWLNRARLHAASLPPKKPAQAKRAPLR